jgi:hypothetical protein
MKTRLVLANLVLVMVGIIAGCDSAVEPDQNRTENKTAARTEGKTVDPELVNELKKANDLIDQAKNDLDQNGDDAQAKAKRALGYPIFTDSDFSDAGGLVARLKTHTGELSDYLFNKFETSTKKMLANAGDAKPGAELRNTLRDELNQQLKNNNLYAPSRFPNEKLSKETIDELGSKKDVGGLSPGQLAKLNRLLLQDSYKEYVKRLSGATVLSHLDKALSLADGLKAADPSADIKTRITGAKKGITQLLSDHSGIGPESALRASDLADSSNLVSNALTDIVALDKPVTGVGFFSFLGSSGGLAEILKYVAIVCAALLVIGGIFWLIRHQRRVSSERDAAIRQAFKKIFDRQKKLEDEFTLLKDQSSAEIKDLANQVSRLDNSYRTLARQSSKFDNQVTDGPAADRRLEQTPASAKEEQEFPVAAETYLQRMKDLNRQSTVIRPDFQNGILVKDPEGRGELVLIQDLRVPESLQRLLAIPSVGQFQMKQDFYNYYDRYYDCDQPSAGDVWILHPAVVETVSGGWRLMEKGRLEVR